MARSVYGNQWMMPRQGGGAIRAQLEETLQDLATAPPTIDVYEIYKPSA